MQYLLSMIVVATSQQTLFAIFLSGMVGGLAAFFMPCIFPMLPLTVGYFTKGYRNRVSGFFNASLYGGSIVVIYVSAGLLITVVFGADALNAVATSGIFNLFFFALLVLFAASFLGGFELTLPYKWLNSTDKKADKKGVAGIFFMAASLALISFSCTGPIIGTLLVQAASSGKLLSPAAGMFGFALALATPFALFAMFPSLLNKVPKSGAWLNQIKVVLGFLELAFSLKFLSNVDLVYRWHILDREVFLVLWIVIFGLMGMYLMGKFLLSNDPPTNKAVALSVPRFLLVILVLSFTIYMIPGLWGAPLKSIAAFLPPQSSQDFDLYSLKGAQAATRRDAVQPAKKYGQLFHAPLGLNAFFDYDEGMAYAKQTHKPVFIDFTGHACVNCRKMEATIWPDPEVFKRLNNEVVLIQLYVDDKTALPVKEQYDSKFSGKHIETIGQHWSDLQASRFNANSQPFYVMLDNNGKLLVAPSGADYNVASYARFIDNGIKDFTNNTARGSL